MKGSQRQAWIFWLCALSCGGASPLTDRPQPREDVRTGGPQNSASKAADRGGRSAGETAAGKGFPAASDQGAGPSRLSPRQLPPSQFQLELGRNEAFLQARLPEKLPGGYQSWQQRMSIAVGQSHLHHASFVDGDRLILAQSGAEGSVRVYERKSQRLVAKHDFEFEEFEPGFLLAWDALPGSVPGAPSYFALATKEGVDLHEVRSGALVARLLDGSVRSMRLSPDKSILMTESPTEENRSILSFFERQEEAALLSLGVLKMEERVDAWDLSRDNRLLAVSYYPSDSVVVYDLATGAELLRINAPKYTAGVAFSPDGRWLSAGGKGLLLVDLVTPTRRAFYSYFYNNINSVLFSPSGDALLASSYDGHIRLFRHDSAKPSLTFVRSFRHSGRANVYRIQFDADGHHLLSTSGDQTIRLFGGNYRPTSRSPEHDEFHELGELRSLVPAAERSQPSLLPPSMKDNHYHPPLLEEAPRTSRIKPGKYSCRITSMYKLRDCTVTKMSGGHTLLQFHEGNLLELQGVLYDDGPVVRYEAWETRKGSVVDCPGCEMQPLHGVFRGNGRNFSGLLTFRSYYDPGNPPPLPEPDIKIEEADDRFPLTLEFKAP